MDRQSIGQRYSFVVPLLYVAIGHCGTKIVFGAWLRWILAPPLKFPPGSLLLVKMKWKGICPICECSATLNILFTFGEQFTVRILLPWGRSHNSQGTGVRSQAPSVRTIDMRLYSFQLEPPRNQLPWELSFGESGGVALVLWVSQSWLCVQAPELLLQAIMFVCRSRKRDIFT